MNDGVPGSDGSVFVIAEVGNNHEGDLDLALKLVQLAADAGADAVKFQTANPDMFVSPKDEARLKRFRQFDLGQNGFLKLCDAAHDAGIAFISTPLDLESAKFLGPVVDKMKIASGDNTFYPLLREASQCGKPLILSTGLADLETVIEAVKIIEEASNSSPGTHPLAILHCVSAYPTPPEDANLRAIATLAEHFDYPIGYSDHTLGIEAPVLAVAIGAKIVEKHFTISKTHSDFRDHQLSADPDELAFMVSRIRGTERLMGDGEKKPRTCESDAASGMRRSIAAIRDLPAGHIVTAADLMWIRPGTGMPPGSEAAIVGRPLTRAMAKADFFEATLFDAAAA